MYSMVWVVGALALGLAVGALVVWLLTRSAAGPGHSVRQLREENEQFREQVNDHFVQTAELINRLTDSYKAVFDHLSEGAERLVDEQVVRERMPKVSDQEIRLKRIGTSARPSSSAGSQGSAAASGSTGAAAKPSAGSSSSDARAPSGKGKPGSKA